MNATEIKNKGMKAFNIIASFSDGVVMKASVLASTEKLAEKKFMDSEELKNALSVDKRKMLQYSIYEQDNN